MFDSNFRGTLDTNPQNRKKTPLNEVLRGGIFAPTQAIKPSAR